MHTVKPVKTATLKKTENWFLRPIIASCRSKVSQNAPRGAFCNTFNLHQATICHKDLCFVYFRVAVLHRFYSSSSPHTYIAS